MRDAEGLAKELLEHSTLSFIPSPKRLGDGVFLFPPRRDPEGLAKEPLDHPSTPLHSLTLKG
jgi:hypothetical protein